MRDVALACVFAVCMAMSLNLWLKNRALVAQSSAYVVEISDMQQAMSRAIVHAHEITVHYQEVHDAAIRKAEERLEALARDNRGLHADVIRLRAETALVPGRIASASSEAVREYAATATDVFEQCIDRYSEMAIRADAHAHDVRTLSDAWPARGVDGGS